MIDLSGLAPEPIVPGAVEEIEVSLWATSYVNP